MLDPILVLIFIGTIVFISGPKKLWRGSFYALEIATSLTLVALSIVSDCIAPNKGMTLAETNYIFFLFYSAICLSKISRIFKTVLNELPQIKAVFSVIANLKPFLQDLIGMLICIFLIYGQIGINSYGGIVNSKTPELFAQKVGKPLPKDYHKINFNDFPNSIVTLYNIFLRNNWQDIQNMYLIGSSSRDFRYFFISFIIVTTVLIFYLIIGFIVEVILTHLNKKYTRYIKIDEEMLNQIKQSEEYDDSSDEDVADEDVFVDDEKEKDLEDRAKELADAFNKGLEKNLEAIGVKDKKLDKKSEEQLEMMPLI